MIKTEINSPETRENPTELDKLQIIHLYAPHTGYLSTCQKNIYNKALLLPYLGSECRTGEGWHIKSEPGVYRHLDDICVPVKSLGNISEKDAIDLQLIMDGQSFTTLAGLSPADQVIRGKAFAQNIEVVKKCRIPIEAIDFIRGKGYALSYKNWSVAELVEFGIYKIID